MGFTHICNLQGKIIHLALPGRTRILSGTGLIYGDCLAIQTSFGLLLAQRARPRLRYFILGLGDCWI